jgi:hypothetical protein
MICQTSNRGSNPSFQISFFKSDSESHAHKDVSLSTDSGQGVRTSGLERGHSQTRGSNPTVFPAS